MNFRGVSVFPQGPYSTGIHEETVRKLSKLHMYDCLRANKSLSAWGVEGRVPFLDKEFLDVAMNLEPETAKCRPGKKHRETNCSRSLCRYVTGKCGLETERAVQ